VRPRESQGDKEFYLAHQRAGSLPTRVRSPSLLQFSDENMKNAAIFALMRVLANC
jgi:hypothetical protein